LGWLSLFFDGYREIRKPVELRLRMTAAGKKCGLGDGVNGSQLEFAGRGRMPEGRDLRRLDVCGELIRLGTGGDFCLGAGDAEDGVWGVVATGEQTSEEAGQAQGSYFEEATSGT
jgi:hypothetical protein